MSGTTNGEPRTSDHDPLGRGALFSTPPKPLVISCSGGRGGKRALYSAPPPPPEVQLTLPMPTVEVHCSACGEQTQVGIVEFAWLHLPFWLWVPWLRYSRFIQCPACERRTWLGVSWAGVAVPA